MPFLIQYLIKLSVSLAVVYLFYRFILRPLTFYTWNRWYLIGYSLIAFLIPFIDINPILQSISPDQVIVINFIPVIDPAGLQSRGWFNLDNRWNRILTVIITGMLVMFIRLVAQFISYRKLRRSSILLSETPVKIFQVNKSIVPFSFGNSIFINREQHGDDEMKEIIPHEFIHVKQKHTADMIWAEALCIINWYNPFAWMIKKVICQNLEFIADQQVLKNGLDKKEYQYLLLKVAGGSSFRITNQFNFSFLRKRISMMNKMKSAKLHLVKFTFILPLLAVLLLSFREKIGGFLEGEAHQKEKGIEVLFQGSVSQVSLPQGFDTIPPSLKLDTLNPKFRKKTATRGDSSEVFFSSDKPPLLYIVDEIIQDFPFVQYINPESIDRIEVLKDKQALQYGDRGKNGVIRIYTKKIHKTEVKPNTKIKLSVSAKNQVRLQKDSVTLEGDSIIIDYDPRNFIVHDSIYVDASLDRRTIPGTLRLRGNSVNPPVVVIIDGIRQPKGTDLRQIEPDTIESMSILKDAPSTETYGPEAVNGVLIIKTKSKSPGKTRPRVETDTISPNHR